MTHTARVVLAGVMLATAACNRRPVAPAADREGAYRANNRGVALLEQFNYPEAAASFREALSLDPSVGIARLNLSLALLYAPDLDGAEREATEAARLLPSAPQPPFVLGLIARAENRNEDAVRFFVRVHQIDARDVGTNVNLGQIYLQDRQYREAIAILREVAAEEPYNVTAVYSLGLALTRAGQTEEGQRLLERSQTLRTTGYSVAFGLSYLEQGRYAEAIASTGAEPDLIETTTSSAAFAPLAVAATRVAPVDPLPFGRAFSGADLTLVGVRRLAASLGGGLTLIDFDGDADLDVFVASSAEQRLFENDSRGGWRDVTARAALGLVPANAVPIGCIAGDYDNDGLADLFVLSYGGSRLYHNDGNGRFRDVTVAARLPPYPYLPGAAAFADLDHDGDLDIVIAGLTDVVASVARAGGRSIIFPREFAPAPLQILRNQGTGAFADMTRDSRVRARTHAIAIVPTDFDNRRDLDFLIVNRDLPPMLFQNVRDGTFRDVAAEAGLVAAVNPDSPDSEVTAVAAGDVNKDDFPDFFFSRATGSVFAFSDGRGRFTIREAPGGTTPAAGSQLVDYDNDGLLDLLTWSADGLRLFRYVGERWNDVSDRAMSRQGAGTSTPPPSARGLALADLDGDGDTDFMAAAAGSLAWWRNSGDSRHRALRVQLRGRVSNRPGFGSKIQVRAGSLQGRLETSSATPAIGPADAVFGLGTRSGADVVRVLWPSGVLQAEEAGGLPSTAPMSLAINELDRKASSCPFLFTWTGERFEFITDFLGGGEMGHWEGPGRWNKPDPVEFVRLRDDQLRPREGRFEIRVTNELEETLFADRFQLVAIAHPRDIEVFPNEGLTEASKPFRLHAVREGRIPSRVLDDHGHDVTDSVARVDRRYPDDFALAAIRGYAAEHALTIDLGPWPAGSIPSPALLLTGWTDYAFSSDNVAAYQAGLSLGFPSLQIKDAAGVWRTSTAEIGIPVGRPQTIAVDLAGQIRPGEREVRIVTNMRIYWDQILVATAAPADQLRLARIDSDAATLRSRGFSLVARPDGKEPERYVHERVSALSPWKTMPGRYTREGDVRELLARSDDMFVIARPGDEIALSFDAAVAGPLPDGWTRTFLLMADGFSKEMDINSASPDAVEPLPFHQMTQYPYGAREHYPDTAAQSEYRETYNTRVVAKSVPSLDQSSTIEPRTTRRRTMR